MTALLQPDSVERRSSVGALVGFLVLALVGLLVFAFVGLLVFAVGAFEGANVGA